MGHPGGGCHQGGGAGEVRAGAGIMRLQECCCRYGSHASQFPGRVGAVVEGSYCETVFQVQCSTVQKHSVNSNTAVTKQDILEIFRFLIWKQSKIDSYNHSNNI